MKSEISLKLWMIVKGRERPIHSKVIKEGISALAKGWLLPTGPVMGMSHTHGQWDIISGELILPTKLFISYVSI